MKLTLRPAIDSDREAVCALCVRLDPRDYLPDAWDAWLASPGNEMLLAHRGEALIGCVFSALVAPGQVFSQGLRVHPDYHRLGVGTLLMHEQRRRLKERKIRVAFGVTGANNRRARTFFRTVGWNELAIVHRRHLPQWTKSGAAAASSASFPDGLLVSREGLAHFRRVYFSADARWLEQAASEGRWHARDGAHVLLDPPSAEFGTWVVALGGKPASLSALLSELSPPWSQPRGLTVESADRPEIQSVLDGLGFHPPEPDDSYVVVECRI
jgi:GNAT superfamily N-acetyltransferase